MARAKHALRAPSLSIAAIMRYLARTTALGRVASHVSPPEPAQQAPTATKTAEDGSAVSLARVVSSSTWSAEAFAKTAAWLE